MRIRHIKGAEEYIEKSPFVIQEPQRFRGNWKKEVFGNEHPLYLEVGMGMGQFIRSHALLHPEISYIGFEINTTVLYKAERRYRELLWKERERKEGLAQKNSHKTDPLSSEDGPAKTQEPGLCGTEKQSGQDVLSLLSLSNLRFIRQDARFLAEDFGTGEIDRIYLNFSDPWPKDKNANKRLTSPVFLKLYDEILRKDGVIEFKTDNEGLFDYSLESIPEAGWELLTVTRDLHKDPVLSEGNIMTEYEAKFSQKGNPIYKLIAGRKGL